MELGGRRVLLTGASGGIGQAIARALHARGATLVLSGRRADALHELAAGLGEATEVIQADLATRDGVGELLEPAGRVDVLVANAGLPGSGWLESFSPEEIDRAIHVNLRAPLQLARALAPPMVEHGSGHLVFLSSMSGKVPTAGGSVYAATKSGLRAFAAALRDELHGTGVGVTTVFPGFIRDAGMFAETGVKLPAGVPTRSPQQVAEAVVRGIERDRSEIDVAPIFMRTSAWLAGVSPAAVNAMARRLGSRKVAEELGELQREKR
jgi:short-subunit dehydrogenase